MYLIDEYLFPLIGEIVIIKFNKQHSLYLMKKFNGTHRLLI